MIHTIANGLLQVTVAEAGAQLQSIRSMDGTEYLWQGDSKYWSDRALNLFPYVARLTEGSYFLDGKRYHMDIHGLAPYRDFVLTEKSEDALTLELHSDERTLTAYPRKFSFRIHYAVQADTLTVTYEIENRGSRKMYFGLGGHPGFRVPLVPGKEFSDYRLRFSLPCAPMRVGFTPSCFLSGEDSSYPLEGGTVLPLNHTLFDDDAIVLRDMAREITLETPNDSHAVTVGFPEMPYLGIWHMPKTDAPYVCIEPWCSLPSKQGQIAVLEEQEDLLSLEPGCIRRVPWFIQIHI